MIELIIAGAGLAMSAAGLFSSYSASQDQAAIQQQMLAQQQAAERERKKLMELDARRKQLEVVRHMQRARSLALTNATRQNAGLGSGLQGGYGQISGEGGNNLLGIFQNLQLGRNMFDINSRLTALGSQYSQAGSQLAFGQGLTSLGGAFIGNAGKIGDIAGAIPNMFPVQTANAQFQPGGYGFVG